MKPSDKHVKRKSTKIEKKSADADGCFDSEAKGKASSIYKQNAPDDEESSDSWDEFERSLDAEADKMLRCGSALSPQEFVNLLNTGKTPQMRARSRFSKYIFIALVLILLTAATNALLQEHGYFARCPGSKECGSCYGPFWGKSWCPNPDYNSGFK